MGEARSSLKDTNVLDLSIVIPTYNESGNIARLLDAIKKNLPEGILYEVIVVDDDSPDGTGKLVENYIINDALKSQSSLRVIHREKRGGLISALLAGIECSTGRIILIMDADFSHPPETIPAILEELEHHPNSVVVASRYVTGASITGWSYKRRIISTVAGYVARYFLRLNRVRDPISGFFAFPRSLSQRIRFETNGYKLLLELLVKSKDEIRIAEIPYDFIDRREGTSKLDYKVIGEYLRAIWILYRYGRASTKASLQTDIKGRNSQLFFSKAGRFFTVGAFGLLVNFLVSLVMSNGMVSDLWYLQATIVGIAVSMTSNFFLNKIWTFEDVDFSAFRTLKQYGLYVGLTSIGALLQLSLLYVLVEMGRFDYGSSLFCAVVVASMSNFLANKKLTFKEKIWG